MKHFYVTPKTLEKVEKIVDEMTERWDYQGQRWQLWDMVATVVSGKAESTQFEDGGIVVRGWNDGGYKNPDPSKAWGGFYRLEKAQMVGTMLRYVSYEETPDARAEKAASLRWTWDSCRDVWWEPQKRVWGWVTSAEFYKQEDADQVAEDFRADSRCRRALVRYMEMSGMWQVRWETTRKPRPENVYCYKTRINATGEELTE